jgi:hypothetical protein
MLLTEIVKPNIDLSHIIAKLTVELNALGIPNPSYTGGFCFHLAARIFEHLRHLFPAHHLEIVHAGGHAFVLDYDLEHTFDVNGGHFGEDNGMGRLKVDHRWENPKQMLKFLNQHKNLLKPDSAKALTVITEHRVFHGSHLPFGLLS